MKNEQKFWYRWMWNYSLGELLGIGAAVVVGRILFIEFSDIPATSYSYSTLTILVVAGATEGVIIGYIQWRSLSQLLQHFKPFPWIVTTTLSTIAGWLMSLPPAILFISFLTEIDLIDNYYSILYTSLVGMTFGGIIGIPQFFIIRKFYKNAIVWILSNGAGWALSFLVIYFAFSQFNNVSFAFGLFLIAMACALSGLIQGIIIGTSLHYSMVIRKKHERKLETMAGADRAIPFS